jgi:hypothetical protein
MSAKIPPKPTKDTIYIDVDDEITSIIDKVENSAHKVVALVLPKRAASLQSIVNMKLLKRSADGAGKNIVLITSEAALIPLAGAAGLHVAKNLQSAPEVPDAPAGASAAAAAGVGLAAAHKLGADEEPDEPEAVNDDDLPDKIDYGSASVGALAAAHEDEHPETIDLDDEDETEDKPKTKAAKTPKDKKNKVPDFDRFRVMMGLGIGGVVALIVFLILAIFVLPKATITIATASEPVSANFTLMASTSTTTADYQKGTIPAKLETTDQTGSQSVQATGQQNNGQKATGTVSMTAQKCSGNPFDLPSGVPAGTGISAGGLSYITQQAAAFHGTGTSGGCYNYSSNGSVDITAQAAGSKYNVSGGTFSVAGRSDVSATGSASGGTDSIVTVLSQSDVDGATQKVTGGTSGSDFTKAFEDKLSAQGEYVLTSTMKAGAPVVTASPAVGQPASTANVTVKVTYTVLTVKKSDLSQSIQTQLAGQIDKSKQKLNANSLSDANVTVASQSSANSATLAVAIDTTAVPIINEAAVKKIAEGKKTGDVRAVIGGWAGVKAVDINLSPFWVSKVPNKPGKITVIMKEIKASPAKPSEP